MSVPLGSRTSYEAVDQSKQVSAYGTKEGEGLANDTIAGTRKALPALDAAAQQTQDMYTTAAHDPGIAAGQNYMRGVMRGDYLSGTPQFRAQLNSLDAAGNRAAADNAARVRSQYSLTGAPLGTASIQAMQAGNAAARARTNEMKVSAIANNAAMERQFQNLSPSAYNTSLAAPGSLMSAGLAARLQPYMQSSQIINSADRKPDQIGQDQRGTKHQGVIGYASGLINTGAGIYGMVSGGGPAAAAQVQEGTKQLNGGN